MRRPWSFDPECAFKLYQQQAGWDVPVGTVNLTMKAVTEALMTAFKENQHSDYNKTVVLGIVITEGIKQAQLKLDSAKAAVPIDNKAITAAMAELKTATDRQTAESTKVLVSRGKKLKDAFKEEFNTYFVAVENLVFTQQKAYEVTCAESKAKGAPEPVSAKVDALLFWREKKDELPLLAEVVPNFFCLDLVSSEIERFFSRCGIVIPPRRNRLGHHKEEIFMVASYNLTRDMKRVKGSRSRAEIAARDLWGVDAGDLDESDGE